MLDGTFHTFDNVSAVYDRLDVLRDGSIST